jgi:hypothetical protein
MDLAKIKTYFKHSILNQKIMIFWMTWLLSFSSFALDLNPKPMPYELTWEQIMMMQAQKPKDFGSDKVRPEFFIPLNIKPTTNSKFLINRIADQSLQSWLKGSNIKNNYLGKTANRLQNSFQGNLRFSADRFTGTEHRLNFTYLAFQNIASLQYTGLLSANLKYHSDQEKMDMEFSKKLNTKYDLILNRVSDRYQKLQTLSLRWQW